MGEKLKAKLKKQEEARDVFSGLSEKHILFFLLEFLAVSSLFLVVWYSIGESYQGAIFFVAQYMLLAMGYTHTQISAVNLSGVYLVNFNLAPLVALAIATPGWKLRERGNMLIIGIPLLFLLHLMDLVAHFPMAFHGSGIAQVIVYLIGVGRMAVPFIIWLMISLLRERE